MVRVILFLWYFYSDIKHSLLFPILVLLHGLTNIKEVFKEVISLYNQKETKEHLQVIQFQVLQTYIREL